MRAPHTAALVTLIAAMFSIPPSMAGELLVTKTPKDLGFRVTIQDQVSDGCWKNAQAVKSSAEFVLRQNGLPLSNADPVIYVTITGLGSALKSQVNARIGCIVMWKVEVSTLDLTQEFGLANLIIYRSSGVLHGPLWQDAHFIDVVEDTMKEFTAEYLNVSR